jgi:hypothetical protein
MRLATFLHYGSMADILWIFGKAYSLTLGGRLGDTTAFHNTITESI